MRPRVRRRGRVLGLGGGGVAGASISKSGSKITTYCLFGLRATVSRICQTPATISHTLLSRQYYTYSICTLYSIYVYLSYCI